MPVGWWFKVLHGAIILAVGDSFALPLSVTQPGSGTGEVVSFGGMLPASEIVIPLTHREVAQQLRLVNRTVREDFREGSKTRLMYHSVM